MKKEKIKYRLDKNREAIMVEIRIAKKRWEVEFFDNEYIEVEEFLSNGVIYDESEIDLLFKEFSD